MRKKLYLSIIVIAILILLLYVLSPKRTFEGIITNEIYLCSNGKEILYVYEKKDKSATIYKFKVGDSVSKLLLKKDGWYLCQPSFSEDEQKIIYRAWQANNPVISFFVANADGSNPKEIYRDSLLFTPKFSKYNDDKIFFVKALEYSNHSPIVRAHPNGMDLYSYNLKTKQTKKHTDENYISINYYDFIDENSFVVNTSSQGIFRYNIGNLKREDLDLTNKNVDSIDIDGFCYCPLSYSQKIKKYLLSNTFDLYLWNGKDDMLELKYSSEPGNPIRYSSFFKYEDKILISTSDETITIIDYKGNVINRFSMPQPSVVKSK